MALHCSSDKRRLDCQVVPNPIWPVCLKKRNFGFAEMAFVGKITFCSSMRTGFSELVQKPDAPTWKWKWVTRDSQKDTSQANTVWKRPCAKHSWKQGPMPEGVLSCPRECHVTQVPVDSHTQVHVCKNWPHIHRRGKAEKKRGGVWKLWLQQRTWGSTTDHLPAQGETSDPSSPAAFRFSQLLTSWFWTFGLRNYDRFLSF